MKFSHIGLAAAALLSGTALASCSESLPSGVCDGVSGACLDLRLEGFQKYESLDVQLSSRLGSMPKTTLPTVPVQLPTHLRIIPPPGTDSSDITSVKIRGYSSQKITAFREFDGLVWPSNSHISQRTFLDPVGSAIFSIYGRAYPILPDLMYSYMPFSMTLSDFDGDNRTDIAIVSVIPSYSSYASSVQGKQLVSIFTQNSQGEFIPQSATYQAGINKCGYSSISSGDINGDGNVDLVVPAPGNCAPGDLGNLIYALNGNGKGSFTANTIATLNGPISATIIDVTRDGRQDLVFSYNDTTGNVGLAVQKGTGSGISATWSPTQTGYLSFSHALGDYDGDGIMDIAAGSFDNAGSKNIVTLLKGVGDGTYSLMEHKSVFDAPGSSLPNAGRTWSVSSSDLNRDGWLDLIVVSDANNSMKPGVAILYGNGRGTFSTPVYYQTGYGSLRVSVGDVDNDGYTDLVVPNLYANTVSVLIGDKTGSFSKIPIDVPVATGPRDVALIDINADKKLDLIVLGAGSRAIHVYVNNLP